MALGWGIQDRTQIGVELTGCRMRNRGQAGLDVNSGGSGV